MKAIKLTIEHQSKLLEMCKELFPSDYYSFGSDAEEDGFIDRNFTSSYMPKSMKRLSWTDEGSHCHWFEFCMTHLVTKLRSYNYIKEQTPKQLMDFYNFYWDVSNYEMTQTHPIDYLYEQFKQVTQ